MAEQVEQPQQTIQSSTEQLSDKLSGVNISSTFNIWPPSQRTRDAVINRLIETLSTPSVLSKRYGSLDPEEASSAARSIEEEAFNSVGGASADAASVDEGVEILQKYSREISKRMLDAVKARSAPVEAAAVVATEDEPSD